MEVFALVLSVSLAIVFIAREFTRWSLFGSRPRLGDGELTQLFQSDPSKNEEVIAILKEVAQCYSLSYSHLRPTDRLGDELERWDTWTLGRGSELLQSFLRKKNVDNVLTKDVTLREIVGMVLHNNSSSTMR